MLNLLELKEVATTATKKETKKKVCSSCGRELPLSTGFYSSKSPLFAVDGKINICKECFISNALDEETGEIDELKFKNLLRRTDFPYYRDNLQSATLQYAKEHGYDCFSTTLLVSPYQNHEALIEVAESMAEKYGIKFLYRDFRVGFREGQAKARELGLYMQKYCGCVFSEEMRYYNRNPIQTTNTNGYEIPKEPRMQVKKIENKEDYIDLLLEADPSKDMIHKYLNDSDVYALKKEDELISIAVILHIDRKTLELKNIVTKENFRNKGYAKTLLKSLCGNYKQKYDRMLVGTTENNIPFYVKQGFDKYEKTIKNFFIDNYKEEIKDGELTCTDLIYYSKDLKKK